MWLINWLFNLFIILKVSNQYNLNQIGRWLIILSNIVRYWQVILQNVVKYSIILSNIARYFTTFSNIIKYLSILPYVAGWTISILWVLLNIVIYWCQILSNIFKYCVLKVFHACFMGFLKISQGCFKKGFHFTSCLFEGASNTT